MGLINQVTKVKEDDVTVGVVSLPFLEEITHHPETRRIHFRTDWDKYDRWGYLFKGRVFVDHLTPLEHAEHGAGVRAIWYNQYHVRVK